MTAQLTEMDGRKPLADKDIKSIAPIEPAAKEDAKAGAEAKADGGSGGGGGGNANAAGGDGDGGGSGGGDDGGSGGDDAAPADDGSGDGGGDGGTVLATKTRLSILKSNITPLKESKTKLNIPIFFLVKCSYIFW